MDQCSVITKGTTPTSIGHKFTTSGPNFIKIESITQAGTFITSKFANISFDAHEALKRSQLKQGDILFSIAGALGRTAIVDATILPANTNQALAIIRLTDEPHFYKEYLRYFFTSELMIEQIEKLKGGAAQQNLSLTQLKELQIPLPPLEEQKRIVSILDEAFEGLDRARENAEANLKGTRELFESVLQETLRSKYQIEREVTLGEVCTLSQGLAINKTTKHLLVNKSSKPLLRIKDLRSGSVEKYVAEEGYPAGAEVFADDIIYTRTGQIGLVFRGFSGVLHNNCFSIRCINGLDRDYCFWWLQERNFRNQIVNLASRAAQPDITHKIFKSQEITLPNEGNQKLAVMSIQDAFNQMQKLQIIYQSKLQDISDLRQSLLQKAFAGELT